MQKSIKTIFLILIILAFNFVACTEETIDTEKPVIEVSSPTDHQHFHPGDIIHFDAEFSDNIELGQFKIDIHFGDGHDHKSTAMEADGVEWDFEYIGELSGRNKHIHLDIPIPNNAKHGEYHFMVYCTDKAGNESWVALEIEIEDDH